MEFFYFWYNLVVETENRIFQDTPGYYIGNSNRRCERVEVIPLTNFAISRLPEQERESKVRELLEYQRGYVKDFVGATEEETDSRAWHLAELVLDFESREFEKEHAQERMEETETDYGTDKDTIRSGKVGKWKKRLDERIDRWNYQEKPKLKNRIRGAERIQGVVVDIFIKDFIVGKNGVDDFFEAVADISDQRPENRKRVLAMLNATYDRLCDKDLDLDIADLNYKQDPDRLLSEQDPTVLMKMLEVFCKDEGCTETEDKIQYIIFQLFELYRSRANELTSADNQIPRLSFFYDLFYAAVSTRDLDVLNRVSIFVIRGFKEKELRRSSDQNEIETEIDSCRALAKSELLEVRDELQLYFEARGKRVSDASLAKLNSWINQARADPDCLALCSNIGDAFEILHALSLLGLTIDSRLLPDFPINGLEEELRVMFPDKETNRDNILVGGALSISLAGHYFKRDLSSQLSLLCPANFYVNVTRPPLDVGMNELFERETYVRLLQDVESGKFGTDNKELERARAIMFWLFITTEDQGFEELNDCAKENREQHRRIHDDYKYFVAHNGDRFSQARDQRLAARGIESVTFYPKKGRVMEHRLDLAVEVDDVNYILPLEIGLNGEFFLRDGTSLALPLFVTNELGQIIFSRLEFITKGDAFVIPEDELVLGGEEERERETLARRSHWRELTGDKFKLQSAGSRNHTEEVKEDYGIDTWEEIIRRRRVGTLGPNEEKGLPNQVVVYVRETVKEGAVPNELVYVRKED
jgi:hypothetical protein